MATMGDDQTQVPPGLTCGHMGCMQPPVMPFDGLWPEAGSPEAKKLLCKDHLSEWQREARREEIGRKVLVFDPGLSVSARRYLIRKLRWVGSKRSESMVDSGEIDLPMRALLHRAQHAISIILQSSVYAADVEGQAVGETLLRRHEWEIATALRDITELGREHMQSNAGSSGPMTRAVLKSQEHALTLALNGTRSRVDALEHYAKQLQAADAAKSDWLHALRVSGANDRYLDLVARTAADEHAIEEINSLTEQASIAQQAFQDRVHEVTLAAEALTLQDPQG